MTVEWGNTPVNRPENTLTGTSFRRGAGCWGNATVMQQRSWTARFAEHWVFDGTGLVNGQQFGTGTVGYETDAVDLVVGQDGVPRITGKDGTPASFVVLATADLPDWRMYGQGGAATMGMFRSPGGGTVFNAVTTGWGNGLADPIVQRITRNVFDRLCTQWPGRNWERIGHANGITAMVACENLLFASDTQHNLWVRDPVGQLHEEPAVPLAARLVGY